MKKSYFRQQGNVLVLKIMVVAVTICFARPLNVNIDLAQFKYDEDANYTELYYSFRESQLEYKRENQEDSFFGALHLQVKLFSSPGDSMIYNHQWRITHSVKDTLIEDADNIIVGAIGFTVNNYKQKMIIEVSDENSGHNSSMEMMLEPKLFSGSQMSISDVELALTITQNPLNPVPSLFKNTYEVKPHPSRQILSTYPHFYYYLETYNLLPDDNPQTYTIQTRMVDVNGSEFLIKSQKKKFNHDSSVEVGYLNLSQLPLGKYKFLFYLENEDGDRLAQTSKTFIYTDPGNLAFSIIDDPIMQVLSSYDQAAVDQEFDYLKFLAKPSEISAYNKLGSTSQKQYFIVEFWGKKCPLNIEPIDFRSKYLSRIDQANSRFSSGNNNGWNTDRGRILTLYGLPNQIEQFKSEIDIKPYEVWYYYNIQGGVKFIFADISGFANYTLMHSTHRNELSNLGWKDYLTK